MLVPEGYVTTDDGLRLWFKNVGTGPQVVVLPNGFHLFEDFSCLAPGRTLVFYDVRNRGRSDTVTDPAQLERGIHNDVDDLEVLRRHFGLERLNLIGHSYMGLMVILYAMKYPAHVDRIVQLAPIPPDPRKQYPPELTANDDVLRDTMVKLAELQKDRASYEPVEFCRQVWSILRCLYTADPRDADKIRWDRCDLPNERSFMTYWMGRIVPSIQALALTRETLAEVTCAVLTVHGTKDRSAAYGGARDWVALLANARLVTVADAGHGPWIEAPETVFEAIGQLLALDGGIRTASTPRTRSDLM
jgi:proline iminopeptidase